MSNSMPRIVFGGQAPLLLLLLQSAPAPAGVAAAAAAAVSLLVLPPLLLEPLLVLLLRTRYGCSGPSYQASYVSSIRSARTAPLKQPFALNSDPRPDACILHGLWSSGINPTITDLAPSPSRRIHHRSS